MGKSQTESARKAVGRWRLQVRLDERYQQVLSELELLTGFDRDDVVKAALDEYLRQEREAAKSTS